MGRSYSKCSRIYEFSSLMGRERERERERERMAVPRDSSILEIRPPVFQ